MDSLERKKELEAYYYSQGVYWKRGCDKSLRLVPLNTEIMDGCSQEKTPTS